MKLARLSVGVGFTVALASVFAQSPASAQSADGPFARDKNVAVRARPHPEYDPLGIHLGGFTLKPKLKLEAVPSDNIYGVSSGKTGDTYLGVTPSFELASNWSQSQLVLFGMAEADRYNKLSEENNDNWQVGARGRLDILRDANIIGRIAAGHFTESRTSANTTNTSIIPIEYDLQNLSLTGVRTFNRLRFTAATNVDRYKYSDGRTAPDATPANTVIDQSYRDRTATALYGRADYAITPDTAVFGKITGNFHDYDHVVNGLNRNSSGAEFLVGANFQFTNVLRGDIGAGWLIQDFKSSSFGDISGYSVQGKLEWFPTQITTVTFDAARSIEDSGVVGSGGALSTKASAQIDHELLRNLILTGQLTAQKYAYVGIDRDDKRYGAGFSGTYLMNRGIGISLGYSYLDQKSTGAVQGPDFKDNKATLSVTFSR
jgi:hypothetical protein